MTKQLTKLTAVLALVFGSLVLLAGAALAAPVKPDPTGMAVTTAPQLDPHGHSLPGQYLVVATLKTSDGTAVANQTVSIYEQIQFVGKQRDALIGTVQTDSDGTAVVAYQPAQVGQHVLIARWAGNAQYAASQTQSTLQVSQVVIPFPVVPEALAGVRAGLTLTVSIVVIAVWLFLIGLAVRVIIGVRSAEGATQPTH